jgi:hypothetical protein
MSEDKAMQALRTGLEITQELLAMKREALGDDYRLTRPYWEAEREITEAIASLDSKPATEQAHELALLVRGDGGAFRIAWPDNLLPIYAMPAGVYKLYASPPTEQATQPARVPLTEEQIHEMALKEGDYDSRSCCWSFNGDPDCRYNLTNLVRAIERAHRIGEAG